MNPIKDLRHQLNLTQSQLADLAGITTQGVLRYEQSLYEHPSTKLVTTLAEQAEYAGLYPTVDEAENAIIHAYKADRKTIQALASKYFSKYYPVVTHGTEHPFITWRTNLLGTSSRMKFCITLALHPGPVAEYEKCKRPYMPQQLVDALKSAGVGNKQIEELNIAGALFYDRMRHTNKARR